MRDAFPSSLAVKDDARQPPLWLRWPGAARMAFRKAQPLSTISPRRCSPNFASRR